MTSTFCRLREPAPGADDAAGAADAGRTTSEPSGITSATRPEPSSARAMASAGVRRPDTRGDTRPFTTAGSNRMDSPAWRAIVRSVSASGCAGNSTSINGAEAAAWAIAAPDHANVSAAERIQPPQALRTSGIRCISCLRMSRSRRQRDDERVERQTAGSFPTAVWPAPVVLAVLRGSGRAIRRRHERSRRCCPCDTSR